MPQITITYHNPKTLQALRDFAKYFDFVIEKPDKKRQRPEANNEPIMILADSSVDTSGLSKIFTGKNIDPKHLRETLWQRKK